MRSRAVRRAGAVVALALAVQCGPHQPPPVVTTPRYPDYPAPEIPAAMRVSADTRDRQAIAWQRLQGGDLGGANHDFSALLKQQPGFYPAQTGLGFVNLAGHNYKNAVTRFTSALTQNDQYVPAWMGKAEAALGLNDDTTAIAAMERVVALDPKRTAVKSRLDLVRFRDVQSLIETGRHARAAGKLEDSQKALAAARDLSPTSTVIFRELAETEIASANGDGAEADARKAIALDSGDAENYAALADVLEARGKFRDAATALARAVTIDPRAEWKTRAAALRDRAELAALPANFDNLPAALTVTRAEVAAFIGIKLRALIDAAPHHIAPVITDTRTHWAASWIAALTQTGVMDVYSNHTFQPNTTVRRGDLARIASELAALAAGGARRADLTRWRAARPRVPDVPATNLFYRNVAMALASGTMTADPDGRFQPTRPASGAELVAIVARVSQIAGP